MATEDTPAAEPAEAEPHVPWSRRLRRVLKRLRRDAAYYFIVLPGFFLGSHLPLPLARALAWIGGSVAYFFARQERRTALENLRHAFGAELSEARRRWLCRRVFIRAATVPLEFLVLRNWSRERLERRFGFGADLERLRQACAERGAVGITAHFGNWEVLAMVTARYLPGLLVPAARKASNAKFQVLVDRLRKGLGLEVFYSDDSPRRLLEILRGKHLLGLLPDQNLRTPNGIFVPFFGRPAYTTTLPAHLARTTGLPMIMVLLKQVGSGYRILLRQGLEASRELERQAQIEASTRNFTQALEEEIRAAPEQWMWIHHRWRTQPGGEEEFRAPFWLRKQQRDRQRRGAE